MCTDSQTSLACCSIWWRWRENSEAHLSLPERGKTFCREWGKAVGLICELQWLMGMWGGNWIHLSLLQTLDQLPLTNPEHFGTPVIAKKTNRGRRSSLPMWVFHIWFMYWCVKAFHSWLSQDGHVLLGNISIAYCKEDIVPRVGFVLNYSLYFAQTLSKLHFPKDSFSLFDNIINWYEFPLLSNYL